MLPNQHLFSALDDIPPDFLANLPAFYRGYYETTFYHLSRRYAPSYARWMLPYARICELDAAYPDFCTKHGVRFDPHVSKPGYPYLEFQFSNRLVGLHTYVRRAGDIVRSAEYRGNCTNGDGQGNFLEQLEMFEKKRKVQKSGSKSLVHILFLHSPAEEDSTEFGRLEIAFPNSDFSDYLTEPLNVHKLIANNILVPATAVEPLVSTKKTKKKETGDA